MKKKYNYELEQRANLRNNESNPVSRIVKELIEHYHLQDRFDELQIMEAWNEVLGNTVARRTKKIYIQDHILFAKLESASLKQELLMAKSRILTDLNKIVGKEVLLDLIFV
ncbi:MAG: DUF721 domain-containing protein [Microscillaceae bacterium]|nr:DUF721 domain-containing protein [Microscillaceae bacterium]